MPDTPPPTRIQVEDDRTGMLPDVLLRAWTDHIQFSRAHALSDSTALDRFSALALAARDRLIQRWIATQHAYNERDVKRAYYFSAEFLMGRLLTNNLRALGVLSDYDAVLADAGASLADLVEEEPDPGLGNGGLGRLAACFLDSAATQALPLSGYGIRYEFGIFEQLIRDGYQVERADAWLRYGCPFEIERPEYTVSVGFGGHTEHRVDDDGQLRVTWRPTEHVLGVPYDLPIAGYQNNTVNSLRLWSARAADDFDFSFFNEGEYVRAVANKNATELISKVLYPNDNFEQGRELRLKQEYFFVTCSLHDIIRRHLAHYPSLDNLPTKIAIQLNDTHPAIAVAELMRVLVDEHNMHWEHAWEHTVATFGYTNHTLMPEALEKWPVRFFERLLPRHLEIIYEINRRFLRQVQVACPHDGDRLRRMSLIEEGPQRNIRMAHLATVGSHSVNGVAALHTELVKADLLKDFAELFPERFNNKTNGVTPRRWMLSCNPALATLITQHIGDHWVINLDDLSKLAPLASDAGFRDKLGRVKAQNKATFAEYIQRTMEVRIDPSSLFDVQIKRLHEYKRQLLNALHIAALYVRHKRGETIAPRTFIFGAKAAPGYPMAKLIIKFIHAVGAVIDADPKGPPLKVLFVPNYNVTTAERIIPAADLSEQISTAGMEASGTGNMKLSMNGALTIGTLDGANVEIRDAVGHDAFFLFGMTTTEVADARRRGALGRDHLPSGSVLEETLNLIREDFFCPDDRCLFEPLLTQLLGADPYFVLADFAAYQEAQQRVTATYADKEAWLRLSAQTIARMGPFSSDRTILQYSSEIWNIAPVPIDMPSRDLGSTRPARGLEGVPVEE